jgi:hypothetical protein
MRGSILNTLTFSFSHSFCTVPVPYLAHSNQPNTHTHFRRPFSSILSLFRTANLFEVQSVWRAVGLGLAAIVTKQLTIVMLPAEAELPDRYKQALAANTRFVESLGLLDSALDNKATRLCWIYVLEVIGCSDWSCQDSITYISRDDRVTRQQACPRLVMSGDRRSSIYKLI